jgi:hypothetical protein
MKLRFLIISILALSFTESFGQEKAYFNQTEMGVSFGNSAATWNGENEKRRDFSLITFHGVKISKNHAVGMSLGFDQYESISVIPIAIGWRGFLGKENKPQLIGGFDFGGGSAMFEKKEITEWHESWYRGGIMLSSSIGVKLPSKRGKTSLTMSMAYKRQELGFFTGFFERGNSPRPLPNSKLPPGYGSISETSYLFHSLVVRMGFMF